MINLPACIAGLTGWRRRFAACAAGAVAALALPPVGAIPILLVAIPLLVWLLDASRDRQGAFGAGWWWGLGWFTAGLYWIANALLIEPERFGWMIPFATLGLGGVLAMFTGTATLLCRLTPVRGTGRIFVLAGWWAVLEWLRSWAFTGFPWNPLGSVWDSVPQVLQLGAIGGAFGLSLFTMLLFAAPAVLTDGMCKKRRLAVLTLPIVALALAWSGGAWRLAATEQIMEPGIRLRLVQAAIGQGHKWRDDLREAHLAAQLELTRAPGFENVTHVIWPETAAPFFLDLDDAHRALVANAAPPGGMVLTGAVRVTPRNEEPFRIWNSLLAIDGAGLIQGLYDKVHLVPFGEYVPLRSILPIAKITHGGVDFSSGPGLRTLSLPGLPPVGVLICYEAIFPAEVVGRDQARPQWLLNLTNDGWFGISAGPYQHLASTRLRAIEEGLPLVRSANTGISAVFDGVGRRVSSLELGRSGVVDSPLPRALPPTIFSLVGNGAPLSLAFLCILAPLALQHRSKRLKYSADAMQTETTPD